MPPSVAETNAKARRAEVDTNGSPAVRLGKVGVRWRKKSRCGALFPRLGRATSNAAERLWIPLCSKLKKWYKGA
jgi:hypothetical protein